MIEHPATTRQQLPSYRWHDKLLSLAFAMFTMVLGMILVVFPWSDLWASNYLLIHIPSLRAYWLNPYFRGAVSGLGVLNLYISFAEVFRLRRFSG